MLTPLWICSLHHSSVFYFPCFKSCCIISFVYLKSKQQLELVLLPTPHCRKTEERSSRNQKWERETGSELQKWERGKWRFSVILSHTPLLHRERTRMIPELCSFFAMSWPGHSEGIKASLRTMRATGSMGAAWAQASDSNWFHCHNPSFNRFTFSSEWPLICIGVMKIWIELFSNVWLEFDWLTDCLLRYH